MDSKLGVDRIMEPAQSLPVAGTYDVVVLGGGIAGIAAALAAARAGAKVCLVEKFCALGGLATLGNVIFYLPLCDGLGHQVCGGISEELLKLSVADLSFERPSLQICGIPDAWKRGGSIKARTEQRYRCGYNPITFLYQLEKLLLKNRVEILFDSRFCSVLKNGKRIEAVIIENKSGRTALRCQAVVDATGDADACFLAGEKTVSLNSNVRSNWYYYLEGEELKLAFLGKKRDPYGRRIPSSGRNFRGDKAEAVTAMLLQSRQMMMQDIKKKNLEVALPILPVNIPTMPCFRMTRRLQGKVVLRERDQHRWYDDCLGMTGDWRKPGPVYCLPLRALAAVNTQNLISAGRCLSAAGTVWDATRAIPTCAVSGEAAGTAAAFLALDKLPSFADLDIKALQGYLQRQKVIIDKKLLRNQ